MGLDPTQWPQGWHPVLLSGIFFDLRGWPLHQAMTQGRGLPAPRLPAEQTPGSPLLSGLLILFRWGGESGCQKKVCVAKIDLQVFFEKFYFSFFF